MKFSLFYFVCFKRFKSVLTFSKGSYGPWGIFVFVGKALYFLVCCYKNFTSPGCMMEYCIASWVVFIKVFINGTSAQKYMKYILRHLAEIDSIQDFYRPLKIMRFISMVLS